MKLEKLSNESLEKFSDHQFNGNIDSILGGAWVTDFRRNNEPWIDKFGTMTGNGGDDFQDSSASSVSRDRGW